jgi:hypothetical protein
VKGQTDPGNLEHKIVVCSDRLDSIQKGVRGLGVGKTGRWH